MAADDDVDIGDLCDRGEVTRVADMGERDDLVDALLLQLFNRGSRGGDVVTDQDVRAGEESSGVSLATAPTMPIFWPPASRTIDGLMRSPIFDL